jgi:hypothetical protein
LVRDGRPRRVGQPQLHAGRRRQTGADSAFYVDGQGPGTFWAASIGVQNIKGDLIGSDPNADNRRMWRWQSIQEFQYPVLEKMSELKNKPLFVGLEQVVPGHEHNNVSVIDGQLPKGGGGNGDSYGSVRVLLRRAATAI